MGNETAEDRRYYDHKFEVLFSELKAINETLAQWRVDCTAHHAHDADVLHLINGNGKPSLAVRLDRLEQSEPHRKEATGFWMGIAALAGTGLLAAVEWFKK